MMTSFEIKKDRILAQVTSDLAAAESFERNIRSQTEHFIRNIGFDDGRDFAQAIRYNQHYCQLYLKRSAAVLELIGLFDPENDSADFETLRNRVARLECDD